MKLIEMGKILCYVKWLTIVFVSILLIVCLNCSATDKNPEITILTEIAPGVSVLHGLTDLRQFANFDEEAQLLLEGGETAKILPSMNSRCFEQASSDINRLIT